MDRMRTRQTTFKSQPSLIKGTREIFYPTVERAEDPTNRTLLILLPGFKREEIKVQLDNAGKLLVKGSRQLADNRFLDVNQSFEVPRDTITERISGRFEEGILTLVMPKKREVEEEEKAAAPQPQPEPVSEPSQQEKPKQAEEKKEEKTIRDDPKTATGQEEKDEQAIQSVPKPTDEKQEEPVKDEVKYVEEPKESEGRKEEEAIQREPKPRKEKQEESIKENLKEGDHVKKEEAGQEKKHETMKEKPKEEETLQTETKSSNETREKKEEKQPGVGEEQTEEKTQVEKQKQESHEEKDDSVKKEKKKKKKKEEDAAEKEREISSVITYKPKGRKKRAIIWRDGDGQYRWMDSGSIDSVVGTLKRNKMLIATAVVAFSVGFYVSRKLSKS